MWWLSGWRSIWWHHDLRSSLENICAPFKSWIIVSTVGPTCRSWLIAWLAALISIPILTASGFCGFGPTTNGDTHWVGPSIFSTISCCSRYSSSALTWLQTWNGIYMYGCVFGVTVESMWSFSDDSWAEVSELAKLLCEISTDVYCIRSLAGSRLNLLEGMTTRCENRVLQLGHRREKWLGNCVPSSLIDSRRCCYF